MGIWVEDLGCGDTWVYIYKEGFRWKRLWELWKSEGVWGLGGGFLCKRCQGWVLFVGIRLGGKVCGKLVGSRFLFGGFGCGKVKGGVWAG